MGANLGFGETDTALYFLGTIGDKDVSFRTQIARQHSCMVDPKKFFLRI